MLGGLLVAAVGPRSAFMVDAVTFLVSAAFIVQLPNIAPAAQTKAQTEEQAPSFWREFREGLSYLIHRRSLVMAVASNSAALLIIFTFDSLGVLALRELGIGEALFGLTVGSIGLGIAAGAIAIGQWGKRIHPFVTMGAGQIGGGLVVALLGVAVTLHARGTRALGDCVYADRPLGRCRLCAIRLRRPGGDTSGITGARLRYGRCDPECVSFDGTAIGRGAGRALGRWLRLYRRGQRARTHRTGGVLPSAGRRNAGCNRACRVADQCCVDLPARTTQIDHEEGQVHGI